MLEINYWRSASWSLNQCQLPSRAEPSHLLAPQWSTVCWPWCLQRPLQIQIQTLQMGPQSSLDSQARGHPTSANSQHSICIMFLCPYAHTDTTHASDAPSDVVGRKMASLKWKETCKPSIMGVPEMIRILWAWSGHFQPSTLVYFLGFFLLDLTNSDLMIRGQEMVHWVTFVSLC